MSTNDLTLEEIVARNSHELTAHLLLSERAQHARTIEQARDDRQAIYATIDEAHRIGLRVIQAAGKGRKTVRIADVRDGSK